MYRKHAVKIFLTVIYCCALFISAGCSQNDLHEKGMKVSQTIHIDKNHTVGDEAKTGWVLDVPSGVFDDRTVLEMDVVSGENTQKHNAPEGLVLGTAVEVTAKMKDASVVYLNKPVTLSMKIPVNQFNKSDEYKYMAACMTEGDWIYMYPEAVDLNNGLVMFETDHFTLFAMVSLEEQALVKKYAKDMVRREWEKGNSKTQVLSRLDTAFRDAMSEVGIVDTKAQNSIMLKIRKSPKFDKMITDIENGEEPDMKEICTELTTDGIISKYVDKPMVEMIPLVGSGKSLGKGFLELDRGNYEVAAKEFVKSVAKAFPATKIMNSVRETIQFGGIAARDWDRFSTNVGYKAYVRYASATDGSYEAGSLEWNKVMTSLYGSVENARYQSLKEHAEKNNLQIADLQKDKARCDTIYKQFCDDLNAKYAERFRLERNLSKLQTEYEKIAQGFIKEGFLTRGTLGYTSDMNLKVRLESLFEARAYILDLFGGKMPTLSLGESSEDNLNQAIAEYILSRGDTARFFNWLAEKGYIKPKASLSGSTTPLPRDDSTENQQVSQAPASQEDKETAPEATRAPAQSNNKEFAWVLVQTKANDWKAAMDAQNKSTAGVWKLDVSASDGSATFKKTYIGKDDGTRLKNGMNESGKATWSGPSHTTIKPGEKFSLDLAVQHLNSTFKYPSSNWMILAQVFRLDTKGNQAGGAAYLADKDGKTSFISGAGNKFQSFSPTVAGTIGAGTAEGDRMAIRVSASNGGVAVQTWYVYEWRAP